MQGLLRAYGPRMEDVFARREEAADIVSRVDDSAMRLRVAQKAHDEAEAALLAAADALDAAREDAPLLDACDAPAQPASPVSTAAPLAMAPISTNVLLVMSFT